MTKQELFTNAWNGLKSQGFQRSMAVGANWFCTPTASCAYRGDEGRRCAIGWSIPDERYTDALEGDYAGCAAVCRALAYEPANASDLEFLANLQHCHDAYVAPDEMEAALRRFATQHNLEIPA